MPRRRLDRMRGDIREFPRYSISEAAFYARIPAATLVAWTRGQDYRTKQGIHRTFESLIELSDRGSDERSVLESLSNHLGARAAKGEVSLPLPMEYEP